MNADVMKGSINDMGGSTRERFGSATGDAGMQAGGFADQMAGKTQKAYGSARDAIGPMAEKAQSFAKARPYATAAAIGVAGLAILNSLRGK